jgi:hypothetical protein
MAFSISIHPLLVALRVDGRSHAASREQIVDLADGVNGPAGRGHRVQQRRARRRQRVVATVGRPLEGSRHAFERTRDHPADAHLLPDHVVGDLADAVLLGDRDDLFVRGDLKNAVGRGVDDRTAGAHVLGAELVDDRGPGRDRVAERRAADAPLELGDDIRGKAVRKRREGALQDHAGHLPVSRHRILAGRSLGHASVGAHGRVHQRHAMDVGHVRKSEGAQRRQFQPDGSRDVAERVAAAVAIRVRVRQLADADAVEHREEHAIWKGCHRRRATSSCVSTRSPAA